MQISCLFSTKERQLLQKVRPYTYLIKKIIEFILGIKPGTILIDPPSSFPSKHVSMTYLTTVFIPL